MLIDKDLKQSIVSLFERGSDYTILKKVTKKTSELVRSIIIKDVKPIRCKLKTISFDNGLKLSQHAEMTKHLSRKATSLILFQAGSEDPKKISMDLFGNIFLRNTRFQQLQTRNLQ